MVHFQRSENKNLPKTVLKYNFKLPIVASILFVLLLFIILIEKDKNPSMNSSGNEEAKNAFDTGSFYNEELFYKGIYESQGRDMPEIRAVILPHHLLATVFIAESLKSISDKVPVIILIGPNHSEKGESKFIISDKNWSTPFGITHSDEDIIASLSQNDLTGKDNATVTREQSVLGIMPYIKYIIPNAKVVPMIIKHDASISDVESVSETIFKIMSGNKHVILIASIDFSHYLRSLDAMEKDEETLKAINTKNYPEILAYDNDNLDSPVSLVVLLKSLEKLGKYDLKVLDHSNSSILMKKDSSETTSYFSIVFTVE